MKEKALYFLGALIFAQCLYASKQLQAQETPAKDTPPVKSVQQKNAAFKIEISGNEVNLRADSTINSMIICSVSRGEQLEGAGERYEWYKVRLPAQAPSYIKSDFLAFNIDPETDPLAEQGITEATVEGSSVNIRFKPDTASHILGKVNQGEIVKVLNKEGEWCRIEPVKNSYGWVHNSLAKKIIEKPKPAEKKDEAKRLSVSGLLKPKTFKRVATHKLIATNGEIYLLRGDKELMDTLNHKKVKVTGKIKENSGTDNILLMVESVEKLK